MYGIVIIVISFQQVAATCQITVCSSEALMRDSWHFQHCTRPQIDPDTLSLQLKKRLKHASHAASFIKLYKSSLIYNVIAGERKRCLFCKWERQKQITESYKTAIWPRSSEITFNYLRLIKTACLKSPQHPAPIPGPPPPSLHTSSHGTNTANKCHTAVSVWLLR